jgi:hypothetical protein
MKKIEAPVTKIDFSLFFSPKNVIKSKIEHQTAKILRQLVAPGLKIDEIFFMDGKQGVKAKFGEKIGGVGGPRDKKDIYTFFLSKM